MFSYIFITLFVSLIALSGYKNKKVGIFLTVLLLLMSMFRGDNVGHDTKGYLEWNNIFLRSAESEAFDDIDSSEFIGRQSEFFSRGLNTVVFINGLPPRTILFVYSIITILCLYYSFKRFHISVALGLMFYVLLGLYFFSYTAARQLAAVSVFLLGLSFLFDEGKVRFLLFNIKKQYLFFIYTFLAGMIHISALFFMWVYIVRFLKINRDASVVVSFLISFIFCLFTINIMGLIYKVFGLSYISSYMGGYDSTDKNILKIIADLLLLIYYYYWIVEKKYSAYLDNNDSLYLSAIVLTFLFSSYSILIARISNYLQVFMCVYLAQQYEIHDRNKKERGFFVVTLFYIIMRSYFAKDWFDMLESGYYLMF